MIGLFLGETDFPNLILNNIKKDSIKYFIIDLSTKGIFKKNKNSKKISIGQFGKILDLIKKKKCKKVLFAGKIAKPNLSSIKLDFKGIYYLPRIIQASKLGDAAILKELIKILNENNIRVIKSNFYNPELTLKKGCYTKLRPSTNDIKQIKMGIKSLKLTNPHDHIQALVIKNNNIIAKETSKGTKKMLLSINITKNNRGILIKFPKIKQDLRVDLPTVGFDTLKDCNKANLKGIVLKSNQNIFLDRKRCINFANKNRIFIKII
jgi:UDP-2,3-diacylglucosamine hydrolase